MARGSPDGGVSNYLYASQEVDPGSIYQMLWGFSPIDSQGRVFYLDTFNNGLGGFLTLNTGAALVPNIISAGPGSIYSGSIFSPPNAVRLSPGSTLNDQSLIQRKYFLGQSIRLGFEIGFALADVSPNYRFRIDYKPKNGPAKFSEVLWDHASGTWNLQTNGGLVIISSPGLPSASLSLLMQIKIVADWQTAKYVRALIGDDLIDLSAYSMPDSGLTYGGQIISQFGATSYGAGSGEGIIGLALLTKDEP